MEEIQLDVGGVTFKTTRSTLCSVDGFFSRMLLSKAWLEGKAPIFIDRDPTTFSSILTYFRSRKIFFSVNDENIFLERLLIEADFYQLVDLVQIIQDELAHRRANKNNLKDLNSNEYQYKSINASDCNFFFDKGWHYVDSYQGNETLACSISGTKIATLWQNNVCCACREQMSQEKFRMHTSFFNPIIVVIKRRVYTSSASGGSIFDNSIDSSSALAFDESFG
jgi:hypothetical protein